MKRRAGAAVLALSFLASCSSAPTPSAEPAVPSVPAAPPVKDNSALLPLTGRTAVTVVPNRVLGFSKLPGGTVADYDSGGRKYQLFIIETPSDQDAAVMLVDAKSSLSDVEHLPSMGGYFGNVAGRPMYVFPRLRYVAGVAGLSKDDADPIARTLAARLK